MIPAPTPPKQLKDLLAGKAPQEDFVLSPSQYDKFLSCERAAGLEYIDGYRGGQETDVQRLGTRVHDILERYVKTGERPDPMETLQVGSRVAYPGQIADVAICLIPPGAIAESELRLTRPNGITWVMKRDLRIPGPVPEVRDYKTTSDFKWMAEKDLNTDTQATVYAMGEFAEHPDSTRVHLHWQFLRTKGKPDSKSLRLDVTPGEAETRMQRIDAGAERWVSLRRKGARGELRGADLAPTGVKNGTCDKYGGCPHRGTRCTLTLEQQLAGALKMDVSAVLAGFTQKQQAVATIPAPAGFVPPPAAAPAPVQQTRPSFWIPGDPMNEDQTYFASKGKPLSFIANLASNPPPPEVSASYDLQGVVTQPDPINAPEKPVIAAVNPVTAQALSPVPAPVVEVEASDGERDALKAQAVSLGLVTTSSRLGAKALKDLIARAQTTAAPAQVPETVQVSPAASMSVAHYPPTVAPAPSVQGPVGFGNTFAGIPAPASAPMELPPATEAKIDAFLAALKPLLLALVK